MVVRLSGGWHVGARTELCVRVAGVLPTLVGSPLFVVLVSLEADGGVSY